MTYRPIGAYRFSEEDGGLGLAPLAVAAASEAVSLIKGSAEDAARQASRMAQNAVWYTRAMNGDRVALARLHVMGGQGTLADHDLILSGEGIDIGPGPWGWGTSEALNDAISKYNKVVSSGKITSPSDALPTIKAVATSPLVLVGIGAIALYAVTRSRGARNF